MGINLIKSAASKLNLSTEAINQAIKYFNQLTEKTISIGVKYRSSIKAAVCLGLALNKLKIVKRSEEICEATGVKERLYFKGMQKLRKHIISHHHLGTPRNEDKFQPSDHARRTADILHLSIDAVLAAQKVASNIAEYLEGKQPKTVAAVSIYTVTQLSSLSSNYKPLSEICKVLNLNKSTVLQAYKQVLSHIECCIPVEWTSHRDVSILQDV